jgi:hypothetical protein
LQAGDSGQIQPPGVQPWQPIAEHGAKPPAAYSLPRFRQ